MDKYTLSAEPYLLLADEHGIARLEFLHKYLPQLVWQRAPDVTFTTIGDDTIELAADTQFPTAGDLAALVAPMQQVFARDYGVFERTYEGGTQCRETYNLPAVREEAVALMALLPRGLDLTNAFSIGRRSAAGPYTQDYITVYFSGDYAARGAISYGIKIAATTGDVIDTKLIFTTVPSQHAVHVPSNATQVLFGTFENTPQVVDVYFAFADEAEYAAYLGDAYVDPFPTTLGKGMVGLTISSTDNVVTRTKRYVF